MFNLGGLAHDNFYVFLFALIVHTGICIGVFFIFKAWGVFKSYELNELVKEVRKTNQLLETMCNQEKGKNNSK